MTITRSHVIDFVLAVIVAAMIWIMFHRSDSNDWKPRKQPVRATPSDNYKAGQRR